MNFYLSIAFVNFVWYHPFILLAILFCGFFLPFFIPLMFVISIYIFAMLKFANCLIILWQHFSLEFLILIVFINVINFPVFWLVICNHDNYFNIFMSFQKSMFNIFQWVMFIIFIFPYKLKVIPYIFHILPYYDCSIIYIIIGISHINLLKIEVSRYQFWFINLNH
jgi:hypothetical protein